jgi:hypothetical protein
MYPQFLSNSDFHSDASQIRYTFIVHRQTREVYRFHEVR